MSGCGRSGRVHLFSSEFLIDHRPQTGIIEIPADTRRRQAPGSPGEPTEGCLCKSPAGVVYKPGET
jgi:hypothetical protein